MFIETYQLFLSTFHTDESTLNIVKFNQSLILNTFLIDLAPNGTLFGAKSMGKVLFTIQIWFGLTRFRKYLSVYGGSESMNHYLKNNQINIL